MTPRLGCIITPETRALHASLPVAAPVMLPAYSRIVGTPRIGKSNLTVGDCACVAAVNAVQTILARYGIMVPIPEEVALAVYSAVTGFRQGDPSTDRGTLPEQLFAWWMKNAIAGYKLRSFTRLNPADVVGIKRAIMLRGGVFLCVALAIEQQNVKEWRLIGTPGTWGEHAAWADTYEADWLVATSWTEGIIVDDAYLSGGFGLAVYDLDLIAA